MRILAIETSCDETAAAVTQGTEVLSSVKVTQEIHSQWGGVVPSLAKRDHEANIDWVVEKALNEASLVIKKANVENRMSNVDISSKLRSQNSNSGMDEIGAIAVTMGPGLAIALGVGISKAKELAIKHKKPLIAVNHVEGHILSSLANSEVTNSKFQTPKIHFPCVALVVSGGHTQVILVEEIGKYRILAESIDDDIGEALDKGARLLGLPYPGGPALEKLAALGDPKTYQLPLPMAGKESDRFSYAGLKTAFSRLVERSKLKDPNSNLSDKAKADLAAVYQDMVFRHLVRITEKVIESVRVTECIDVRDLLVGGGVIANSELKKRLSGLANNLRLKIHAPTDMVLCTDNAAMIGVAAGFKVLRGEFVSPEEIDRKAKWRVDTP